MIGKDTINHMKGDIVKRTLPKTISIGATAEEISQIELIKRFHHRKTTADMLRYLIAEEVEKILAMRTNNVENKPQSLAK